MGADPPPETSDELYDEAPVGYLTLRPNGVIARANGTLLSWLGRTRAELIGERVQTLLTPGARIFYETHCGPILRAEGSLRQIALDLLGAQGKRLPALLDWRRIRGADGTALGYRVLVVDASERRLYERELLAERERARDVAAALAASEAELRRLNEGLEARVREEVAAREEAQARAFHAARMQALGRLAGGIAHDINNVLQAVLGGASLIEKRTREAEDIRRLAALVIDAADRGASVTRRLLAFSRRSDLRTEVLDAGPLLDGLYDILRHAISPGVEVRLTVSSGLPSFLADKAQLETVLVNLATNACDAMPGGGVMTFTAEPAVVRGDEDASGTPPAALAPGRYVRLSVIDTGEGMSPETLARVTEPFFTTKGQAGTGLGLAMAKGFAEQSGGALHIDSVPGLGTTVALWLPAAAVLAPAVANPSSRGDAGETSRRALILLVDDDSIVREVTAEQLTIEGYSVLPAPDGPTALALLEANEAVNLIVSDLSMPGMDGLATIHEARQRRPGLPSILLTGFADNAATLAIDGALSGRFSLLRKPVTSTQLTERIEALLETADTVGR